MQKHGLSEFNLVALCDPVLDNANLLADEAAERFGTRPAVVPALAELAAHEVQAVDITTTPRYHHTLAVEALELGWHVMCEKPVGLTVECCRRIREAQRRTGRVLSVAIRWTGSARAGAPRNAFLEGPRSSSRCPL